MKTTAEFKVWKTVRHPYYWTKSPIGGRLPEGSNNPAESAIDLVQVWVEDLHLEGKPATWNLEKAARKGKALGLTFVPDFILEELGKLILAEFRENHGPLVYAMANDFGQVFPFGFKEGEFATFNGHGVLCLQCGISSRAPLIFVKPRKQERQ